MGNHASNVDRRSKPGDPYTIHNQNEGRMFNIDKHPAPKPLVLQMPEESVSRSVLTSKDKKVLPCVIKWNGGGKDVAVAGSFNNWQALPMVKSEKDFVIIVDLPEGDHEYKFFVDGEWKLNTSEEACSNPMGTENNIISVKEKDFEELENALLKDPNDKTESPYSVGTVGTPKIDVPVDKDEDYSQDIPDEVTQSERKKGPPILPPHFLQVILNKDTPVSCEPTLLPEPNHVIVNHMYALSIRDGMLVLSTSHRYRKKCVTTVIYRPI